MMALALIPRGASSASAIIPHLTGRRAALPQYPSSTSQDALSIKTSMTLLYLQGRLTKVLCLTGRDAEGQPSQKRLLLPWQLTASANLSLLRRLSCTLRDKTREGIHLESNAWYSRRQGEQNREQPATLPSSGRQDQSHQLQAIESKPERTFHPENQNRHKKSGRYWARTSDLFGVNEALSH